MIKVLTSIPDASIGPHETILSVQGRCLLVSELFHFIMTVLKSRRTC